MAVAGRSWEAAAMKRSIAAALLVVVVLVMGGVWLASSQQEERAVLGTSMCSLPVTPLPSACLPVWWSPWP